MNTRSAKNPSRLSNFEEEEYKSELLLEESSYNVEDDDLKMF